MNIKKFFRLDKKIIIIIIISVLIMVFLLSFFAIKKTKNKVPKEIREVAIMIRSQQNNNSSEDKKTSLKKGDVLVVQKNGHNWSKTENISYLILKMNLTDEQASKLTQAKTKNIEYNELSQEEKDRINNEKKQAKDAGEKYTPEPRTKTLIAREYYIDLTKNFPDFKATDVLNGQPFFDKVYDWGIVAQK